MFKYCVVGFKEDTLYTDSFRHERREYLVMSYSDENIPKPAWFEEKYIAEAWANKSAMEFPGCKFVVLAADKVFNSIPGPVVISVYSEEGLLPV